ncbi:MAG TPA: hypothetical protein ENJ00_03375 [Phycisphaerales bacterium]|nr:hypothetical protein [Phycisphaerales bacterium]
MHFQLIDRVLERTDTRVTAIKAVTAAEEYLKDHFPTFPVLPGVLMLEAMVQTGRELTDPNDPPMVLGRVRALKYGSFVRPGDVLEIEVKKLKELDDGSLDLRGKAFVQCSSGRGDPAIACVGRFTLRPIRLPSPSTISGCNDQLISSCASCE